MCRKAVKDKISFLQFKGKVNSIEGARWHIGMPFISESECPQFEPQYTLTIFFKENLFHCKKTYF